MNVVIKGRHIDVTTTLRERARQKLRKIEKQFNHIIKADVELSIEAGKPNKNQICEITLFGEKTIFRARAESDDMYTAIDEAVVKIEKQIEKHKGRAYVSENKHVEKITRIEQQEAKKPKIVKKKTFEVWRMSLDEALLQMEFLAHDFFIFIDSKTERMNIIYKRRDGNFGLIEPVPSER